MTHLLRIYPTGEARQLVLEQHQPHWNGSADKAARKIMRKSMLIVCGQPENALELRLWAIAGEIKANMPEDVTSDQGWLYDDETGLPK